MTTNLNPAMWPRCAVTWGSHACDRPRGHPVGIGEYHQCGVPGTDRDDECAQLDDARGRVRHARCGVAADEDPWGEWREVTSGGR